MSSLPTPILVGGIGLLVAWRLYARIRRLVGRQRLAPLRPWITVTVFPLALGLLLLSPTVHAAGMAALAAGCALGLGLGVYGLRTTTFEATPEGLFYTPNAHLGIALSLLLVGRILYRFGSLYLLAGQGFSAAPPQDFGSSPLTLAILGTVAGYYVTYAAGLLRWRRRSALARP